MTSSPNDPQARPDVVQALFGALIAMDPGELAKITAAGITSAERQQAEDLYAASLTASLSQQERFIEAMRILTADRNLTEATTWRDLLDGLTPEHTAALRDLYDALPDGARAEWDRRYGRPASI
jgi:hypothetical protein